uniref:Uncharacterized protein n=1 Tax=Sphaerodactylus townsendi TaxID=933632 RepID=A0ACB8F2L2_9SAUR
MKDFSFLTCGACRTWQNVPFHIWFYFKWPKPSSVARGCVMAWGHWAITDPEAAAKGKDSPFPLSTAPSVWSAFNHSPPLFFLQGIFNHEEAAESQQLRSRSRAEKDLGKAEFRLTKELCRH